VLLEGDEVEGLKATVVGGGAAGPFEIQATAKRVSTAADAKAVTRFMMRDGSRPALG
jgi:hypothetical protein